jgi:type I restriction enzyme S subunit
MKATKVKSSNLSNSGLRMDASLYLSEGIQILSLLNTPQVETKSLKDITSDIFYGNRSRRVYVTNPKNGIPFIKGADITKSDFSTLKLISKKKTKNIESYALKEGWTLITRSGSIGNTAFVNGNFVGKAASDDIIRVCPKDIPAGFLYAYLSSKFGNTLITQSKYGAVIQHIEPAHIENIPVPLFPESKQQEIHNLIVESANLRVEANGLLEEAIAYFDNKIEVSQEDQKLFSKSVKQLSFSWASYNNNTQCDFIEEQIGGDSIKLNDISEKIFAPPMFKHIYLDKDNGNPFLTGAELTRQNPKFYRWLSPRGVKDIEDYRIKKGTLLLYKSGTTDGGILGNVFIADDNLDGVCLSDHVIRITMTKFSNAYWAYAFLKSKAGVQLLLRLATGTMIPFITPERLKELSIPRPDKEYERITDLINEYISKRVLADNNESKAISLVEKEIESWQQS